MSLTNILTAVLAVLSLSLPGIFKSDGLALWKNGLIALAVVAFFSFFTVFVGGKLTGNFTADWVLFAGVYGALLAGPAQPLDQWLQSNFNLPFLKPAPANINPVRVPTALTLPPDASPVPPRASQPPTPGA